MNVNFKPSIAQGKSLRFGKSNDGKKTLLRPINLPQISISETDNIALLMHLNGTDGSTIFNDFSLNQIPLTGFRNTVISTGEYKFGGASAKFTNTLGTTRDYIGSDNSSAFNFISGNSWTYECWVNPTSLPPDNRSVIFSNCRMDSAGVNYEFYLKPTGSIQANKIYLNNELFETGEVPLNTWTHVAFSYDGNLTRGFINGVKAGEKNIHINVTNTNSNRIMFGANKYVGVYERSHLVGYMDEVRITTGVARYINNFVPPTGEFPNPLIDAGLFAFWKLDNLIDSSPNGNNLVNLGSVQFVPGKIGNCAQFNGSNELRGANIIALNTAQNFSVSFWANPSANVDASIVAAIDSSNIIFRIRSISDGSLEFDSVNITGAFTIGTWKHYVCINAAGRTKIYINGSEVYNQTSTTSYTNTTTQIGIGDMPNFFTDRFEGKIDTLGIWQRELTLEEIITLYNDGNGLELL